MEQGLIANQPVVIDNGSGLIKAGFAGENAPKKVFANYVGRPKHVKCMVSTGGLEDELFVGALAERHRGLLKLVYPMEHGIVHDWNDMERVWTYVYSKEVLNIRSEEHPVLLTEPPLNPYRNREKAAEIFFETFNAPGLFFSMQAVLSLYASGRTTGVVLDSGDGVTHAVPVVQGFALPHSIVRADVAGRDVCRYLRHLIRLEGRNFNTSSEFEVVRSIKEKACQVSPQAYRGEHDVSQMKLKQHATSEPDTLTYKLPDGDELQIGAARFRAPECLFRPELIGEEYPGIHEVLHHSVQKSDLELRKELYANIVLSGGSTLFHGFGDRLLNELKRLCNKDVKISISSPSDRMYSTWMGGSILASLDTFRRMWITKDEFMADGGRALLHKKSI